MNHLLRTGAHMRSLGVYLTLLDSRETTVAAGTGGIVQSNLEDSQS